MTDLKLSQALEGYLLMAQSRRLSHRTLDDYFTTYKKLLKYLKCDPPVRSITVEQIRKFLASFKKLSAKTILNYHTGLSALWGWMEKENIVEKNIVRQVAPPRPEKRAIKPYSKLDVQIMLSSLEHSSIYSRFGKKGITNTLDSAVKARAIILLLLDTGIRASELCKLTIGDFDMKNRRVKIFGKGMKERILPVSPTTAQAIWRYLSTRGNNNKAKNRPLFLQKNGVALKRRNLYKLIRRIGNRAGVDDAGVHRFRHTFATTYLRKGGHSYALQISLGHSSSDMTRRYLNIVDADIQEIHNFASPVSAWRL
jgi:site-specific recombinase XerD